MKSDFVLVLEPNEVEKNIIKIKGIFMLFLSSCVNNFKSFGLECILYLCFELSIMTVELWPIYIYMIYGAESLNYLQKPWLLSSYSPWGTILSYISHWKRIHRSSIHLCKYTCRYSRYRVYWYMYSIQRYVQYTEICWVYWDM